MIEETGVVIHTDGEVARVLLQRMEGCERCTTQGVCRPSQDGMEIEAFNPIGAKVGERVKIAIKSEVYLKGSMIAYGLPLIALISGAILGKNIGDAYFKEMSPDITAAILGFAFLITTFIIIKIWGKKAKTKTEYKPIIEEVVR